ncbi:MAG: UvrD-helicase domain-containing protein [Bdellovibrionota bacterium]
MNLQDFLNRESVDKGLSTKFDRLNKFRLLRTNDQYGFHIFILENIPKKEKIIIGRFLFDRFRSILSEVVSDKNNVIDKEIKYKDKTYYRITNDTLDTNKITIQELNPKQDSTGFISLSQEALPDLCKLLYHKKLYQANEVLQRIISYHKLFQFTFSEGSDSITSDLLIKKDVLSHSEPYVPFLGKRLNDIKPEESYKTSPQSNTHQNDKTKNTETSYQQFKSRLAERSNEKAYQVNYDLLFKGGEIDAEKSLQRGHSRSNKSKSSNSFHIPLLASDIKHFSQVPFRCEFSTDEINELRQNFLGQRDHEFYIGFEIMDAIYKKEFGRLQTFRFPLYYMKIRINESGRILYLEPVDGGRVYLNHLALVNLVAQFSKSTSNSADIEIFLQTLLAQSIDVGNRLTRIYLTRNLPYKEEIFQQTREILLGFPDENGKGGILSTLNIVGIECDLESVYLYKIPKVNSPTSIALENDLDEILSLATSQAEIFNQSLLGGFLSSTYKYSKNKKERFCHTPWIPGAIPKSTRNLLDQLDANDLVLLEGPPGTGKTFTIMNLFIHCICSKKRLLIVSDQKSAIHALTEKIEEYLVGKDRNSSDAKGLLALWENSVKIVDEIPTAEDPLSKWIVDLKNMLKVDLAQDGFWPEANENLDERLNSIEQKMIETKNKIQHIMDKKLGANADAKNRVTPKRFHPTTESDIENLYKFIKFVCSKNSNSTQLDVSIKNIRHLVRRFVGDREFIAKSDLKTCYNEFNIPHLVDENYINNLKTCYDTLNFIEKTKPRKQEIFFAALNKLNMQKMSKIIQKQWEDAFPNDANIVRKIFIYCLSLFRYPLRNILRSLKAILAVQLKLARELQQVDPSIAKQFSLMHQALDPDKSNLTQFNLEICRFATSSKGSVEGKTSIQEYLDRLGMLQAKRDKVVRLKVLQEMNEIAKNAFKSGEKGETSLATSIASSLDSLKNQRNIDEGAAFYNDLRSKLSEAYPIWICRKQAVPFLFPVKEQNFDLVIVDEATQCRVDDALPLLYRAKKILVVGDEKQTVLAKNSVVDDYLFREFSLEEHLRQTQARGIKGGGSHLFGLIKGIKQGHVMLDEHYRCPPDIIQYSNKYVYNEKLRKMQWTPIGSPASLVIDYKEKDATIAGRQSSGQYKGIETDMVDRFLDFVGKTVLKIEKETGDKINLETDVALCYFLLKNEPYIKRIKQEFLRKLNRGNDILDGAGAALQGKERDYIFYLWDVDRSNMLAFRQGDDEDKRKGEMNVLMSRPKKRAYHYLHKNFDQIEHRKASITEFLWDAYLKQYEKNQKKQLATRHQDPGPNFIPWRRSSGQLMEAMIEETINDLGNKKSKVEFQYSVAIGDPRYCVDLMLVPHENKRQTPSLGLVDLCAFDNEKYSADYVIDYYFQLKRAIPSVNPIFLFMHELADDQSRAYKRFLEEIRSTLFPHG